MKKNVKKWLFPALAVLVSLVAVLVLAEILLRILNMGYANKPTIPDPVLEYRNPSNSSYLFHIPSSEIEEQRVFFDEESLVYAPYQGEYKRRELKYRIAFLGDSFVEAKHVSFTDSFVGIIRDISYPIAEVKNYGVSSYSPLIYLLQWRNQVSNFQPTHVFVLLFSNDVEHDERRSKIAVYDDKGEIIGVPGNTRGRFRRFLRNFYVARFFRKFQLKIKWALEHRGEKKDIVGGIVEVNPDISDLTASSIRTLSEEISDANAQLFVMVVPSKFRLFSSKKDFQEPEYSDKWKKWCQKNHIAFIDLVKPFQDATRNGNHLFFDKDIHFNKEGHRIIAQTIMNSFPHIFAELQQ